MDEVGVTDGKNRNGDRSTSRLKMMKMLGMNPEQMDKTISPIKLSRSFDGSFESGDSSSSYSKKIEWPSDYLFAQEDSEENILYETGVLQGGTVVKLVEKVTAPKELDPSYLFEFLLTYRSFTTGSELISLLKHRWNTPIPTDIQADEKDLEAFQKAILKPIRLRIFNLLKKWIDEHWYDFEENPKLVDEMKELIEIINGSNDLFSSSLNKLIAKKSEKVKTGGSMLVFGKPPPQSYAPDMKLLAGATSHLAFLAFHPEEVARQMTLIEHDLFKSIKPWECTGQAWAKKDKEEKAANILGMILRFNKVSMWVKNTIVMTDNLKARVEVLTRFIEISAYLREMNNFNGIMEMMSGLRSASVHRLKKTWSCVSTNKLKLFDELMELMSPTSNYTKFRTHLHTQISPPCIPYLGVYLSDLTFLEDGNPDTLEPHDLINFDKRRRAAKVIQEIKQYQQTPYNFNVVPIIKGFLLAGGEYVDENQIYKTSLEIEPKGSFDEKDKMKILTKKLSWTSKKKMIRSSVKRIDPVNPPAGSSPQNRPTSPAKFDLKLSSNSNTSCSPPESLEGSPTTGSPSPMSFSDSPGINRSDRAISTESIESDREEEPEEIPFEMLIEYLLRDNNWAFEKYLERFDYYQAESIRSQTLALLRKFKEELQ